MSQVNILALILLPYWLAPYLLISRIAPEPPIVSSLLGLMLYILGVVIMMTADAQKHFTLTQKKGLITTGMFGEARDVPHTGLTRILTRTRTLTHALSHPSPCRPPPRTITAHHHTN